MKNELDRYGFGAQLGSTYPSPMAMGKLADEGIMRLLLLGKSRNVDYQSAYFEFRLHLPVVSISCMWTSMF